MKGEIKPNCFYKVSRYGGYSPYRGRVKTVSYNAVRFEWKVVLMDGPRQGSFSYFDRPDFSKQINEARVP